MFYLSVPTSRRDAQKQTFFSHQDMPKYFLYCRKSTDEEERQVLSIEAQLAELREFAKAEKLEIVDSLCESKTAKEPGRTKFGEMLDKIEHGQADGIIAWHPDRLARNSIDGGKIIYLVDTGKIKSLKFPTFWFESTPQGKFMLNIAFGQSKYFVDNLSENVKRGFRQKLRRGEYPGAAPLGYINNLRNHSIELDKNKHKLVKKLFELYSTGEYTLDQLTAKFNELGLTNQWNRPLILSVIHRLLKNPFYCGLFRFKGEIYEGTHEPIITKSLFEKIQGVMVKRGKNHKRKTAHNFAFTGLMKCSCGCAITAEIKKGHTYYRCTKKKGHCDSKYVREEDLTLQLRNIFQKGIIKDDWLEEILLKLDEEQKQELQSSSAFADSFKKEFSLIDNKLDKLLDSHLEGTIEKQDYIKKKEQFINQKKDIEEKIKEIKSKGNNWLEPIRDFILLLKQTKKVAMGDNLLESRAFLKKIGSNFILKDKKLEFLAKNEWEIAAQSAGFCDWQGGKDLNLQPCFWRTGALAN